MRIPEHRGSLAHVSCSLFSWVNATCSFVAWSVSTFSHAVPCDCLCCQISCCAWSVSSEGSSFRMSVVFLSSRAISPLTWGRNFRIVSISPLGATFAAKPRIRFPTCVACVATSSTGIVVGGGGWES